MEPRFLIISARSRIKYDPRACSLSLVKFTTRRQQHSGQSACRTVGPSPRSRAFLMGFRPTVGKKRSVTVEAITYCIRTSNFGWARPNQVFSQDVFQKFATGRPKFGAECAPQPGDSRSSRRVWTLRAFKKNRSLRKGKKVGAGWREGFRWYERAGERHERTQAVGLKEWWAGLHSAERDSEFTAAGRRAGLANELHPEFEFAKPMAVPNLSSDPSEV